MVLEKLLTAPAAILLLLNLATVPAGRCATFSTLYTFTGGLDGFTPYQLVVAPDGVIYGVAINGGQFSRGLAYSLTPPTSPGGSWTETTLWSFGGPGDGTSPLAITLGRHGVLYGGVGGGANGAGAVFSLTPPASPGGQWTEALIYNFTGGLDGSRPSEGLVVGAGDVLYGTTALGGANKQGTVFSLTPPAAAGGSWAENVIWSFDERSGFAFPTYYGLAMGGNGVLYGVTQAGGANDYGMLYSVTPPSSPGGAWTEATIHSYFRHKSGTPSAITVASDGTIYVAISSNRKKLGDPAGAVFSYKPPASPGGKWKQRTVFAFPVNGKIAPDGYNPVGPLALAKGGALYGVARDGGATKGSGGVVFELSPPTSPGAAWTPKVVHAFRCSGGGAIPGSGLVEEGGVLYGSTIGGCSDSSQGSVFSVVP
jgi:uncharacterized repeat protein (TIGR03803 family)